MSCIGVWVSHVTYKWRHQGTIATPGEGGGEEEEEGEGARRRAVKLPP